MTKSFRPYLRTLMAALALPVVLAAPALAASHDALTPTGDAAAGKNTFARQCVACHVVVDPSGTKLAGRNGRTGPNLYGVAGRTAGTQDGFKYGRSLKKAGQADGARAPVVWNEQNFVAYVQDPTGYLRKVLGDKRARAKMTIKVRAKADAVNLYAYLYSLAPPAAGN